MTTIEGGCLCGRSRYVSSGVPLNVRACHCHMCQKATGAPFYARVQVALDGVTMEGPIGWHGSSDEVDRGFCTDCGTTLFSRRSAAGLIGLTLGSVDDPTRFTPEAHIWTSSKQAWVTIDSAIPQFAEGMLAAS